MISEVCNIESVAGSKLEVHGIFPAVKVPAPQEAKMAKDFDNSWIHVAHGVQLISFGIDVHRRAKGMK